MSEKTEKKTEKPDVKIALATFKERAMAALVDYGIVFAIYVVGIIIYFIVGLIPVVGGWLSWLLSLALYLLGLAAMFYIFVWMPFKNDGQSYGKKMQKIKLMLIEDEAKWTLRSISEDDLSKVLVRALIGWIEAGIGFGLLAWYFITNDKNSQRFADQLGKTIVVQVDESLVPLKKPRTE
ncbi:MAG: RDD family protein [Candidatus Heimdallarchaeota archaeon]